MADRRLYIHAASRERAARLRSSTGLNGSRRSACTRFTLPRVMQKVWERVRPASEAGQMELSPGSELVGIERLEKLDDGPGEMGRGRGAGCHAHLAGAL